MAAPTEKTLQNLAGKWSLNKGLSDDITQILELQGVNVMIRKATGAVSVHLKVTQPSENEFKMEQTATAAGIGGTTEQYVLDWEWRKNHDAFFGDVEGRSRWISQDETKQNGAEGDWKIDDSDGKLVQAEGNQADGAWKATHFWGFEEVGGARRHTRRVKMTGKDGKELKVRMVYDYDGE